MRHIPELLDDADQRTSAPAEMDRDPFGDIPRPIWTAFLLFWALLFGLFVLFFATDGPATLAILTSCFFAFMILGLPAALGAQSRSPPRPWPRRINTGSGPLPVGAAAAQILLIPVAAVLGLIGFIILAL
jgi:peptidoglycan/LPS O-acetylase OafA/YrhL